MTKKIKYPKTKLKKFRKTILDKMENISKEMVEMKNVITESLKMHLKELIPEHLVFVRFVES